MKPGAFSNYEKKAIFSLWLMRRIGASGSGFADLGRCMIPLASRLEPSEAEGPISAATCTGDASAAGTARIGSADALLTALTKVISISSTGTFAGFAAMDA